MLAEFRPQRWGTLRSWEHGFPSAVASSYANMRYRGGQRIVQKNKFYYKLMKTNYLILLFLFLSCFNNDNITNKVPLNNFCGYGVIKFSKSYEGSIRYMEFFPIIEAKYSDIVYANKIKININNGIIIRGNNSTNLWQALIKSNKILPDEYGYYKSLIFIDLSYNTLEYNYKRPIPNEILIQNKIFKTKTFDYIKGKLNISNYKIFYPL